MPAAEGPARRVLLMAGSVLAAVAALMLLALPPEVQPDTASYLAHYPERAPLYPYLIDLFSALFGLQALVWLARFQEAMLVASGMFFAWRVGRALDLDGRWRPALFLLLVLPGFKFAAVILTESLGYSLLVVFWALFAEWVLLGRDRRGWLSALCAASILLRPQFLFLPVFYGVCLLGAAAARRERPSVVGVVLFAMLMAVTVAARGADNLARHGSFSTASSGGVHLLASLLYIAEPADGAAISDHDARRMFEGALAKAEGMALTRRHWTTSRAHFDDCMVPLVFDVVRPGLHEALPPGLPPAEQALRADRLAMAAAGPLLAHMPGRFAGLLARKFYDAQPLYYALVTLGGILALWRFRAAGSRPALLLALAALHSWLSYGVVLLAGVYAMRYIFPAESVLLSLVAAVGASAVQEPPSGGRPGQEE